jgi:hypothetical protein
VGDRKASPTSAPRDFHAAVSEAGVTPLEYMLSVLRDPTVDAERRDRMAAAAAPYIHPRLSNVEAKIDVTWHEAVLAELEEIEAALS